MDGVATDGVTWGGMCSGGFASGWLFAHRLLQPRRGGGKDDADHDVHVFIVVGERLGGDRPILADDMQRLDGLAELRVLATATLRIECRIDDSFDDSQLAVAGQHCKELAESLLSEEQKEVREAKRQREARALDTMRIDNMGEASEEYTCVSYTYIHTSIHINGFSSRILFNSGATHR